MQIRGEQILVTMGGGAVMDEHPVHGDKSLPEAMPVPCAGHEVDVSAGSPLAYYGGSCALRHLSHHLLGGGHFLAIHAGACQRGVRLQWWRFVLGGITIKLA